MRPWPHPSTLADRLPMPRGAGLRLFRTQALEALPERIRRSGWGPSPCSPTQMVWRRGFRLYGLVPGFDRDQRPDGTRRRVTEALFGKLRVPLTDVERPPSLDQREPDTAAMLDPVWPDES